MPAVTCPACGLDAGAEAFCLRCGGALPVSQAKPSAPTRPLGIVVLAAMHGLAAGLAAFLGGLLFARSDLLAALDIDPLSQGDPRVVGGLCIAAAVLATVVAYGLLTADVWAWALALATAGAYAALGIWSALQGRVTALPTVLLAAAAVVYLSRPSVRAYLHHAGTRQAP